MTLTVIILDATNMVHMQEPCTRRSVQIELTPEQVAKLALRNNLEEFSTCFIEPPLDLATES